MALRRRNARPVLLPFLLFAVYLVLRARYPLAIEHWTRGRVATLILAGLAAALAGWSARR